MANRRSDNLCVQIRICVSNETETDIIKYQAAQISKTGKRNYRKTEAASDYLEYLSGKERDRKNGEAS